MGMLGLGCSSTGSSQVLADEPPNGSDTVRNSAISFSKVHESSGVSKRVRLSSGLVRVCRMSACGCLGAARILKHLAAFP